MVDFSDILEKVEKAIEECPKEAKDLKKDLFDIYKMIAEVQGELKYFESDIVAYGEEVEKQLMEQKTAEPAISIPASGEKIEGIEEPLTAKRGVGAVLTETVWQVYEDLIKLTGGEKEKYISLEDLEEKTGKSKSVLSHYLNRLKFFGYVEKRTEQKKAMFRPLV